MPEKIWTKVNLLIGKRKTGKTFFTCKLINAYKRKVLVVDTFAREDYASCGIVTAAQLPYWRSGNKRIIISDLNKEEVFEAINKLTYTLVIFEDCGSYLMNIYPPTFARIIADSKNKDNEIITQWHGWSYIHPKLCAIADTATLFKNSENIKVHQGKIPLFHDVLAATEYVNASDWRFENKFVLLT